jgi:hypothetical protein
MGVDTRVMRTARVYARYQRAGHMWMTYLDGRQVSSDVAVVKGEARWWRHVTGKPGPGGTFDYWIVHAAADADIERRCGAWICRHLPAYTGMMNIETIAGTIIEAHLRMSDQWPDLYGPGWVDALVKLYAEGVWDFDDRNRRDGYSVVLFGRKGRRYRHPPAEAVAAILGRPGVSSLQVTFHEGLAPARHVMPPGGFRLAIVNCWDLAVGRKARDDLKPYFPGAYDMSQRTK